MRTTLAAGVLALLLISFAEAQHRPGHGGGSSRSFEPFFDAIEERLGRSAEPLQIFDAFEQRLGQYTSQGCFIRRIEGYWVEICGLDAQGQHDFGQYFLLYSDSNCQGQAYLSTAWQGSRFGDIHTLFFTPLVSVSRRGFIKQEGGPLVFAADPIEWVTVRSWQDPLPGGDCINLNGEGNGDDVYQTFAGPAVFVNISDWTPPFSIR